MKPSTQFLVALCVCLLGVSTRVQASVNGGTNCAGCVIVVAVIEQLTEINNDTVVHTLEKLCSYLPKEFRDYCDTAVEFLGPVLVELIVQGASPDVACTALKFCYTDPGQPTCHSLEPPSYSRYKRVTDDFELEVLKARASIHHLLRKKHISANICDLPGIKEICEWIEKFTGKHDPLVDADGDGFSTVFTVRGTSWRGKDCSDTSSDIHPGSIPQNSDRTVDSNCNGIFGVNNETKVPWEDALCGSSEQRGVTVLGDSISAHFHIPPEWLDATRISEKAFEHLVMIVENELDWPMISSTTGFTPNNWTEAITGPVDSFYLRLRERNRCNHRDYQNIAANGERSSSVNTLMHTLSRQAGKDRPIVVFYALVGNDVCNGHPDTFAHMTTPQEMHDNVLQTLEYLGKTLPNNSYVALVGLADGQVLYDNMGPRIHPLGTYWGTFTYSKFYDFLNCLQVSPCLGWMNSNKTIRDMTTQRAEELTAVLKNVSITYKGKFSNFKLYFLENPIDAVMEEWRQQGGEGWQLIEPVDGFHANQMGNYLLAGYMWKNLTAVYPEILGPENPNNALIEKLFGDQGGH